MMMFYSQKKIHFLFIVNSGMFFLCVNFVTEKNLKYSLTFL